MSHESQIRVPAFYPDTPVVRRDIARYYDLVTAVDCAVKDVLDALDRGGVGYLAGFLQDDWTVRSNSP